MGLMSKIMHAVALTVAVFIVAPANAEELPNWGKKITDTDKRFVVLAKFKYEAVLDRETGLVWQRTPGRAQDPTTRWRGTELCHQLNIGGRMGWRRPTVSELSTLIDPSKSNPALPTAHPFQDVNVSLRYWTSSTRTDFPANAWAVSFGDGTVEAPAKADQRPWWCVRSPYTGHDGGVG